MPKSTKKIDIKESENELPKESNKKEESIEDKKKGKNKKEEPINQEPKEDLKEDKKKGKNKKEEPKQELKEEPKEDLKEDKKKGKNKKEDLKEDKKKSKNIKEEPTEDLKEDKKKGKNKKDEPVIEDKNNKKEVIQPVKEKKVIDISKVETEYNETFKEWESVNQSLSNLKKEITTLEEKRHNILTQLNKLLKKMQGDENENIINPLETPSILKKEITKVIIQPKVDSDDSSDEDENSESFKKGIQNFNKESDSDTDSD